MNQSTPFTGSSPAPVSDAETDRYTVPALERGLRILCEFNRDHRTLSAPELARRFGLPRSTVFRLLNTLESLGFIERSDNGRNYALGVAVLRLGFEYLASLPLTELGQPLLERLSKQTQQPCNLVVRDERSIVYVARVSPPSPFVSSVHVGTRLPAHATVLGHLLLGDLDLPELQRLYPEGQLKSFSSSTPRTTAELFDAIQTSRQQGYALGQGYFEAHISTVAAPVRDHTRRVVAAMSVSLNTPRIPDDRRDALLSQVRESADELSALLNYAPETGTHISFQHNRTAS